MNHKIIVLINPGSASNTILVYLRDIYSRKSDWLFLFKNLAFYGKSAKNHYEFGEKAAIGA